MNSEHTELPSFQELGLSEQILQALEEAGYEAPTPIQARSIPPLLAGRDLLGQAQTGTGKTAAFALPLLSRIDTASNDTQLLVLAPTRELAIQVAEAFQTYARRIPSFHVLPLYGGQEYSIQLKQLRRGAQVVVGTPGRIMDHMRRGTLKLEALRALVLDEADEMLRMGFIDDVEWILQQTPPDRQVALFSATMPDVIRKVARTHLKSPEEVRIQASTSTATTIRQRYWRVSGLHKLDALTRLLESEPIDGMLVFVRTKHTTVELAEKLTARGYNCEALNGDIVQKQRERTVGRLKKGQVDIVVATDVAARGLDVERISHVLNYDIPADTESYVHRIGRTGRAGRSGEAILFVAPREQRMLQAIERATRQPIEPMRMPTADDVNEQRISRFKQRITDTLSTEDLEFFQQLIGDYVTEHEVDPLALAAALAHLAQGDTPFLLEERSRTSPPAEEAGQRRLSPARSASDNKPKPLKGFPDIAMARFRVDVGYQHGVKPGNLVGAIANEAQIDSRYIGAIDIHDDYATVDLPQDIPKEVIQQLSRTWVCGRRLGMRPADQSAPPSKPARKGAPKARKKS
ncbi:MAG: DEAD/DEAH box helicase [Ectothiorhodospiraceae bacterium]|nr:DEAD/DEAH box helicase [Ectothiorhodospiraceae bacterium]MCH8503313.1 DEAD/DEAH box helicase [Ectothiorhodospiraceae bacterium]